MARLDIYDNPIEEDRCAFPYVMDIQSDLLYRFAERVCVPLAVLGAFPGMTERFNPAMDSQITHLHPLGIAVFLRNESSHPRATGKPQMLEIGTALNMLLRGY
ncbi:MAG: CcdB family protein [Burkholderiales bacterium]|nr:CcdB family protein [Burkholderiales bacterium]